MPLARITTPLPEYYERLAQDLRARGFDVETATSGQFQNTAADLEITVKQCGPEEVGRLTAAASATKDMCVIVTPEARQAGIRSIEMIVLQPKEAAVRAPGFRTTPAQVIEISAALIDHEVAPEAPVEAAQEESSQNWPKMKVAAASTWDDVVKTTLRWLTATGAACGAAWRESKQTAVPLKNFLLEVGDETRALGRKLVSAVLPMSRKARQAAEENEQLVPSMFDLSAERAAEEGPATLHTEQEGVVKPRPRLKLDFIGDRRFLKAAGVGAVAAVGALLAVSAMQRSSQPETPKEVESKSVLPAASTLKPSAMVAREGQKAVEPSPVRMVAAKQVMRNDTETDDVVVRYPGRRNVAKPAAGQPQIKRYSDLN